MADFENIPIDKSVEDFNYMHPVLWLNKKPTNSTVGKLKQLAVFDDISNKKRQIYYCGNVGNNYYNWQLCAETNISDGNDIDLGGYVPKTRKIAGIDLADDITIEQLQTALGIGNIETALDSIISIQENLIGGATE